jgi:hypothetical protein
MCYQDDFGMEAVLTDSALHYCQMVLAWPDTCRSSAARKSSRPLLHDAEVLLSAETPWMPAGRVVSAAEEARLELHLVSIELSASAAVDWPVRGI